MQFSTPRLPGQEHISIGPDPDQVSPATYWVGEVLQSVEAVEGALLLAYMQGLDGLGPSPAAWMGLSDELFELFKHSPRACADYLVKEEWSRAILKMRGRAGVWREDQLPPKITLATPVLPVPTPPFNDKPE